MWSVVITDQSRFMFNSPSVVMIEATYASLKRRIKNEQILKALSFIGSDEEIDIFMNISDLCGLIVPFIPTSNLILVIKFFTSCLTHGQKSMWSPLYSVATGVINSAREKRAVVAALADFTARVRGDKNPGRRSYREIYCEAYFPIANSRLILQNETPEPAGYWPEMPMFERIVAVKIPHLYEVSVSEVSNITLTDLNSFPPLLPFEPILLTSNKFQVFQNVLCMFRFEPFTTYRELTMKLLTSLVRSDDLADIKHAIKLSDLHMHSTVKEILPHIEIQSNPNPDMQSEALEDEEESKHEEVPPTDPSALVFVQPVRFLPTVDDINTVGNELFEDPEMFGDRLEF
jgi:hypothetical protein